MNLNEDDYRHALRLRYVEIGLNLAEALELVELTESSVDLQVGAGGVKFARLAVERERSEYLNGNGSETPVREDAIQEKAGMFPKIWDHAVMLAARRMIEIQREVATELPEVVEPEVVEPVRG